MSFNAVKWAMKQDIRPAGRKFTLVALATYANNDDGTCFPSQGTLAGDTGQGLRTIRKHVTALVNDGFIQRQRRHRKNGSRQSDGYKVVFKPDLRQPADIAGSQPAETAGRTAYRQNFPHLPAESAGLELSLNKNTSTKQPSSLEEPSGTSAANGGRLAEVDSLRSEMEADAAKVVRQLADKRLEGDLRMIVPGDDMTAWHDPTGKSVPWPDRPRLLRLALEAYKASDKKRKRLRSSLKYVIAQQYDPIALPTADSFGGVKAGSEAATVTLAGREAEYPGQYRSAGTADLNPVGRSPPKTPEDELREWEQAEPDAAQSLKAEVIDELREAGMKDGSMGMEQAFKARYRSLAMERVGG